MKILLEWLKDYVEAPAAPDRLAADLVQAGVSVETVAPAENNAGTLLDIEITPNRPDLLSHYGVAREVAALYGKPLKPVAPVRQVSGGREAAEPAAGAAQVEIAEPDLCHRYVALVLRGVKVQPSPDWLRRRLEACGISSINNVVDVTNYVLLELGHPTHAFDLDTLAERRVIVRCARPAEKLRTLDGVERTLKPHHLVIADARRAVALAGVMGGAETEISFRTKNILLESAWFDPVTTRRTARDLGLNTEASYRFERGMDPEAPLLAARRCAELFLELAGGELLAGAIDVCPRPWQAPQVQLRQSEIERLLGQPLPGEAVERILTALGFRGVRTGEAWQVAVPSWRRDVALEADLIEELARQFGYDKLPARLPVARAPVERPAHAPAEAALRAALESLGYDESVSFSLVNPAAAESFVAAGESLARLANPLSEEFSALRPSGLLSLIEALRWNINRGQRHARLYELGKGYAMRDKTFRERRVLTFGATGALREKSVLESERDFDLLDLKGGVEAALAPFALGSLRFAPCQAAVFDPAARAEIRAGEKLIGALGKLSPALAADFKLRQSVFLAELDLDALYAAGLRPRKLQPPSRFPAVERDFSLLLEETISFGAVEEVIRGLKIPELTSVAALDVFRGGSVPAGRYSLLVRVILQSGEETLTDEQVQRASEHIVEALEKKLGASLRA